MGMYGLLTILFLFLIYREIDNGPEPDEMNERVVEAVAAK
jgi:hypothetical protein